MDFHGLSRKELQALCKLNKIPANITNVAMADALKSLEIVEGIEDILNPSESADLPVRNVEATAAKVPRTGRRTCTRTKPIAAESESVQPMTKSTRRTTRRVISDEIMEESTKITYPKTPAARSTRKTVVPAVETEAKGDVKDTPALATYSRRKDVATGTNLKEGSTVQRVYSTRRSTRLVDKKEDKIDSLATELSKIDLDVSHDLSLSGNDSTIVLQESINKSDAVASQVESNNKDDDVHEEKTDTYEYGDKAKSEEVTKVLDGLNDVQEDSTNSSMIMTDGEANKSDCTAIYLANENENDKGLDSLDTENPSEQVKSDVAAPEFDMEIKENNAQEEIVNELKGKSEQLFDTPVESHIVHEVNVNSFVIGNEDNKVEESSVDTESEILNNITCTKESDAEIVNSNDLKDNAEIEMDYEKSFPNEVGSFEGGPQPVEHTTCAKESEPEIINNTDPIEKAAMTEISSMDSDNYISNEVEPSLVNQITEEVESEVAASILEDAPVTVVGSLDSSYVASPIHSTVMKTVTEIPSIKGLTCVSDDKENIGHSGMKFVRIKEAAKINKAEDLNAKSLRELSKMLKEKLQISNTTEEVPKLTKIRPALQKLEDNRQC